MNTKSFVNGLDPENTVKGYYDENDHLVMVEPEGSGGGDVETAVLTVINTAKAKITFPLILEGRICAFNGVSISTMTGSDAATVPLGSAGAVLNVDLVDMYNITIDGDIEDSDGVYMINGDCSITITSRS